MKLNTLTLADALRGSPSDTLYVVNRNPVVNTVDRTSRKPDIVFQVENTRLVIPGSMVGDVLPVPVSDRISREKFLNDADVRRAHTQGAIAFVNHNEMEAVYRDNPELRAEMLRQLAAAEERTLHSASSIPDTPVESGQVDLSSFMTTSVASATVTDTPPSTKGNIRDGVFAAVQSLHAGAGADVVQRTLDGLAPFHPEEVKYVMNSTVDPVIRKYISITATN